MQVQVMQAIEIKKIRTMELTELEKAFANSEIADELCKAKGNKSAYINPDGTFKGGFKGCVRYQMEKKGLAKDNATRLCAYIGRRAGKIP